MLNRECPHPVRPGYGNGLKGRRGRIGRTIVRCWWLAADTRHREYRKECKMECAPHRTPRAADGTSTACAGASMTIWSVLHYAPGSHAAARRSGMVPKARTGLTSGAVRDARNVVRPLGQFPPFSIRRCTEGITMRGTALLLVFFSVGLASA